MSHAPDDYALVIGIDHYPMWAGRSLQGSSNDARAFRDWLVSAEGGGLPQSNVRTIVSSEEPPGPLQDAIDREFDAIRRRAGDGPKRRFYFYFSGHGHSSTGSGGEQALCLANWSLAYPRAALDLDSYRKTIVGCVGFEEALFFVDCCRVRQPVPPGKPCELECFDPRFEGRHWAILYGTEHYNAGYEGEVDADIRGFFTTAMLRILKSGTITLRELRDRLEVDVPELAKPRIQQFRMEDSTQRQIVLGPPVARPAPPPPPMAGPSGPEGPLTPLRITLKTDLDLRTGPGEPPAPAPGLIVVRSGDAVVAKARGALTASLPPGAYSVAVHHGEAMSETKIRLPRKTPVRVKLPKRHSAAPLWSTVDKHEYITLPIEDSSRWAPLEGEQAVFVALWSRACGLTPMQGRIALTLPDGDLQLPAQSTARFLAAPGTALLRESAEGRCLPLPVAHGWDTQVFLVEEEGKPRLDRASIFMSPAGRGFDPSDALLDAYERAVADLVTAGPGPDAETLNNLLYGKWRNPLFGLVGAHFLVRRMRRQRRGPDRGDVYLLEEVIGNLGRLLGRRAPDIFALEVLRARLLDEAVPELPARLRARLQPPLLRAGLQALFEASADHARLLPSSFDQVGLGLIPGSPWSCWSGPVPGAALPSNFDEDVTFGLQVTKRVYAGLPRARPAIPAWLVDVARDEIAAAERQNRAPSVARLTRHAHLPRSLCEAALRMAETRDRAVRPAESSAATREIGEGEAVEEGG